MQDFSNAFLDDYLAQEGEALLVAEHVDVTPVPLAEALEDLDDGRLARARLAREYVEARPEFPGQVFN